jgi:ATP-dependent DNA helicase RecG
MKKSIEKLQKFFKLESERGFDNHAVLGGLVRMLDHWEAEARAEYVDEDLIRAVSDRIHDYSQLSPKSRAEAIDGLWRRVVQEEQAPTISFEYQEPEQMESVPAPLREPIPGPESANQISSQEEEHQTEEKQKIIRDKPEITQTASKKSEDDQGAGDFDTPVSVLHGVGPRNSETLEKIGIRVIRDLLYYFPRRYDDYSKFKQINRLTYGEEITIIGTIQNVSTRSIRGGKNKIVEAVISDGSGDLRITWFNQPWVAKRFHKGFQIVVSGKIDRYLGRLTMNNPEWEPLDKQHLNTARIVPVYPLTSQITQRWLRRLMNQVVSFWAPKFKDPLPANIKSREGLMDLQDALVQIHFPDSEEELKRARFRIAFDEIFLLQLGVLQQKRSWQERTAVNFPLDNHWWEGQKARLPFTLTDAQRVAIDDIKNDLESGHPMNRLLQGDVGSGKTVIAAVAISAVSQFNAQSALMAPTSILAEQHYYHIQELLQKHLSIRHDTSAQIEAQDIRLLLGSTPETEKDKIRSGLSNGSVKLVIGTHALIEDPIDFANLQLVIIDEQHRFGVEQRAALRSKGTNPHLMVLTATPIPRSLALTIYGDLDLSVIDELPPGRKKIETHILTPYDRERVYAFIRKEVEKGNQAFFIYPLVEESDKIDSKAAVEEHTRLQHEIFPDLKIGLLHGRLRPAEKESVMADFRNGAYQILVSTSVVEVGVDIPNATVIVIEGAHRFGLSQLHQFRGRVGRGSEKSYCILIPDSADNVENERLKIMAETDDGFILAERDLELRGPGQFLGTRQSGYSDLRLANLTDIKLISNARKSAQILFENDPELKSPQNQGLKEVYLLAWGTGKGDIS